LYESMAILAAFVLLYSLIAGRVARTWVSGPIIFVGFGLVFGPAGFDLLALNISAEWLRLLAELTLALVLFTDAANANLAVLRRTYSLPTRLLLIGLPLTIAAGFGVGWLLFPGLSLLEVAVLATMLAPTDAALGEAVVENEEVPDRIREALNVESGLNDGICVPILFVFLALASDAGSGGSARQLAVDLVAREIGIGMAVGLALALATSWLLGRSIAHGWLTRDSIWIQIPVVGLSVACFASSQALGGSGFIAAFCGGLLFGGLVKKHKAQLLEGAEGTGETLALLTWVVFGAAVVGRGIGDINLAVVGYAVLSLTLVRMIPVALCVVGCGLNTPSKAFLGWFGPRGLASIVFGIIVIDAELPGGGTITAVVVATITLSIIAHGITATPLSKAYGDLMRSGTAGSE